MAQETILKVSLKDYKKGIDDLRASLLGLDKDSEEYGKIVQEIAERQDNLNDAMNAGKQAVNAVDGSYNALAQTLSNLKKEWKNMEMGTPEWEAMAVRINDINNQLKDADASVGVFTRNVGDYANAFEEAFKQAAGGLSSMPGTIGQIAGTTNKLIPLIKKAATTATTGLSGVKKALMSTGIGALVVAVGLLIANFDKLQNLFRKSDDDAKKLEEDVKTMNETFKEQNETLATEVKYMEAQGASTEDVNKKKLELIQTQNALTQSTIKETKAKIDELKAHSAFRRWITGENKDIEKYEEILADLEKTEKEQAKEIKTINTTIATDKIKEAKKAADEEKKKLDEVLKRVKENSKSEIQTLTDKYNEEYALLKKHGKDTAELTKQYQENIKKINKTALDSVFSELGQYDPAAALQWNFEAASEQVEKFQKIVDRKFPPEGLLKVEDVTEDMIEQAKKLGLVQGDTALEFTVAWQNAYQKYKSIAKDISSAWYEDTEDWQETMDRLWDDERFSEYYNQLMLNAQGTFNVLEKDFKDFSAKLKDIEAGTFNYAAEGFNSLEEAALWYKTLIPELEKLIGKYGKNIEDIMKASEQYQNEHKNILIQYLNLKKENDALEAQLSSSLFSTTDFYEIYQKRLEAAEWYRNNLEIIEGETNEQHRARVLAAEQAITDIKKEYKQKQLEIEKTFVSSYAAFGNSLLDIQENQMKQEMKINENGEKVRRYTDEDIFNATKDRRISLGWLETIQGSLAAFMGYQEYPQPYGALLGAAAAAATFAAGVAQIEAIKATQFDSAGNNVSNPTAVINATPRLADYSPDTIQNLTGASETQNLANALQQTPIYVSVTDINNAQAKVTDRNNESSF